MTRSMLPDIAVIDDALPDGLADALLGHAIANEGSFTSSTISSKSAPVEPQVRSSLRCSAGLGPFKEAFESVMANRFEELCRMTGTSPFALSGLEIELVAHRDGHFYHSHIDTVRDGEGMAKQSSRLLSSAYYLHRQPRGFSGGDIRLTAIIGAAERSIEARHNRLVAFPSFTPHEVLETHVSGNAFADARFSVNCWFLRNWDRD